MDKIVHIEGVGNVVLRRSNRARHYLLRVKGGQVIAVMPAYGVEQDMLAFIEKKRTRLQHLLKAHYHNNRFDERTTIQTLTFSLHIFRISIANFYVSLRDGILHIACPLETNFDDDSVQQYIQRSLRTALRAEANRYLSARTTELANIFGFRHASIAIRDTQTRWGSCSNRKNISLSLMLMRLPTHLVDYVILHELCHTVEMNHGHSFWKLMDHVTNNRAQSLRYELKTYNIFS